MDSSTFINIWITIDIWLFFLFSVCETLFILQNELKCIVFFILLLGCHIYFFILLIHSMCLIHIEFLLLLSSSTTIMFMINRCTLWSCFFPFIHSILPFCHLHSYSNQFSFHFFRLKKMSREFLFAFQNKYMKHSWKNHM